ncbi:MAG: hypothetical protein JXR71_12420 [Bacteroidales bacterium]|nr:hypothetical protein [Bacteroidales bacterium]
MKRVEHSGDELWLKAAVVGGLWASVEIIIGSFLHNTRIPFAGSILAFFGTVLLIGFYQLWPQRGVIIRAGLITALMKSVSPSALILGPMTGIFMEALLIEVFILLLGNNLFAYSVSGVFSLSSALFHKIISIIIVYGFNIVTIYVNIINFGLKQMGISVASDVQILLVLLAVYLVMGTLAGVLGYVIGKKALQIQTDQVFIHQAEQNKKEFFSLKDSSDTSLFLLFIHLISIPFGLYLVNSPYKIFGYMFVAFYLISSGFFYRKALQRLRKPIFWSQLLIIVLLSTLFWDVGKPGHQWLSEKGFFIGLEMMVRALFIIVAFSALSVELRNKQVRSFLNQNGFGNFYHGLELAFGALPVMISLLPTSRELLRSPKRSLLKPLIMADQWLEFFKNEK